MFSLNTNISINGLKRLKASNQSPSPAFIKVGTPLHLLFHFMFPDVAVRRGSDVDVQSLSCYTVKGKVLTCFLLSYIKQTKSGRVITGFGGIGLPPPYLAYWTLSSPLSLFK